MSQSEAITSLNSRALAKERRREQLIKSTINCIARRGIAGTTMADVTQDAGLSLGIVNLHFQSKDKLFEETLLYLSDEYEAFCADALVKAGKTATEKLAALVELDFSAKLCDRKKLAVWFAFWGEAKSRPTYLHICAENDRRYNNIVANLCDELIAEGKYKDIRSLSFATGLAALANGLWLDLLMSPNDIDRKEARDISFDYLAVYFPDHFDKPDWQEK
jgi:TetR/AcrR family transcriptional regulator, transcriptional repressor of bet genes